jgi:glycosyltransferase involved in cell wall biosynthesis
MTGIGWTGTIRGCWPQVHDQLPLMSRKKHSKLLFAVTSPVSWIFYRGLVGHLTCAGFRPMLLSSPGPDLQALAADQRLPSVALQMEREISPIKDLIACWRVYRVIRKARPDIVDASTPKAGLLVGIAAWLARVPCRVYCLRGLRLETTTGLMRFTLWLAEWTSCACSNRVVCVSSSLRERVIALKIVPREKTIVIQKGSSGIDMDRFRPMDFCSSETKRLSRHLGIPDHAPVVGFVGRLVRDKGIYQLVEAFRTLREKFPEVRLLVLGSFEDGDPVDPEVRHYIETNKSVIYLGFVTEVAPYYRLMDVLAFPTHREGFGQVALEAQASGVPVVTTTATGAIDSVIDGVTGFLVPIGDSNSLSDRIAELLADDDLRSNMGREGRSWIERDFSQERIWRAQTQFYRELGMVGA